MKKIIHKNPWFSLEKHFTDKKSGSHVYFFLNKKPTVFIVAETKDKKIILIQEYRFPINKTIWQLPAGMVDTNNPLASAKEELLEETQIIAAKWKKLGEFFVAPGHENTQIIVYVAKNLEKQEPKTVLGESNIKNINFFSQEEIKTMIGKNKIKCGITLASLNLYFSAKRNIPI
ncbi:MAG: NUDIX hydrolase [bacterium]|nr:NUDIX hydrolase [bacterium]